MHPFVERFLVSGCACGSVFGAQLAPRCHSSFQSYFRATLMDLVYFALASLYIWSQPVTFLLSFLGSSSCSLLQGLGVLVLSGSLWTHQDMKEEREEEGECDTECDTECVRNIKPTARPILRPTARMFHPCWARWGRVLWSPNIKPWRQLGSMLALCWSIPGL